MGRIASNVSEIAADGARFNGIGEIQAEARWQIAPHSHPDWEMLIFRAGRHWMRLEDREHWSEAGDVLLVAPGRIHAEHSHAAARTDWIFLHFTWPDPPREFASVLHDGSGRMRVLAEWLLAERQNHGPLADAFLRALLAEFVAAQTPRGDPLVLRTRAYLREHLDAPLSVEDMARRAHLSKFHFIREYRRKSGRTPAEDFRIMRLEYARELLLTTSLPLKAIAPRAGVGDQHALSRLFRKYFGLPPRELRVFSRKPGRRQDVPE